MKTDHYRYIARVTIEFVTPFHVGSGWEGEISDADVVTDANGLPALPGTSITGALRAAIEGGNAEAANDIFGYQRKRYGQGSRLSVSWGYIHDAAGRPVEGLIDYSDHVLENALNPRLRDHVRLTHQGVGDAAEHAKFDELNVSAGHRFTFEMELVGTAEDQTNWDNLLTLISTGEIRLGGKTRRGLGSFKVVSIRQHKFNLQTEMNDYIQHPASLAKPAVKLTEWKPNKSGDVIACEIALQPRGYWMFGGGEDIIDTDQPADMVPVRDCRIVWNKGTGSVGEYILVIPGSSLKGAIAHRVAFHYNALKGVYADRITSLSDHVGENNRAVQELFGYAKDSRDGRRGIVMIDDIFVDREPESQLVPHVSIDRFTGGARQGALFSERPLWRGKPISFKLVIDRNQSTSIDRDVREAFRRTLDDLGAGRLQIGAGAGRGTGFFESVNGITWSDSGKWIGGNGR